MAASLKIPPCGIPSPQPVCAASFADFLPIPIARRPPERHEPTTSCFLEKPCSCLLWRERKWLCPQPPGASCGAPVMHPSSNSFTYTQNTPQSHNGEKRHSEQTAGALGAPNPRDANDQNQRRHRHRRADGRRQTKTPDRRLICHRGLQVLGFGQLPKKANPEPQNLKLR